MAEYKYIINKRTSQWNLVPTNIVLEFKPCVSTHANLPLTSNEKNDARVTTDTGHVWIWSIEASSGLLTDWTDIGDIFDGLTGPTGPTGAAGATGPTGPAPFIMVDGITYARTSAGINAAIDALGSEGGKVFLTKGTYIIDSTITIDYDNTIIEGEGVSTILDSSSWSGNVITTNGKHYNQIKDLKAIGNSGGGGSQNLIDANSNNNLIENCILVESDGAAITITGHYNKIINNYIDSCDDSGIAFSPIISGPPPFASCKYNKVIGNTILNTPYVNPSGDFIAIGGWFSFTKISKNYIYNTRYEGIGIGPMSSDNIILENIIDKVITRTGGAYLDAIGICTSKLSAPYAETNIRNIIANNIIKNTEGWGIHLGSSNNLVIGNKFFNNCTADAYGISNHIFVNEDADYCQIIGNSFDGNSVTKYGIYIDLAEHVTIANNHSINNTTKGLRVIGTLPILISGNIFSEGTRLGGIPTEDYTIENNTDIKGELSIKVYSQVDEPTLTADNRMAIWIDTNDNYRVYLIFKRTWMSGLNDQIKVELT